MFEKMIFDNKQQEDEFNKYKDNKSKYLFLQFYNILIKNDEFIKYSDVSSCIRYDKNLRDTLYIYLATFEEFLRAKIFDKYDVGEDFNSPRNKDKMFKAIIPNKNNGNSYLYYNFQLDLGSTIDLVEKLNMYDNNTINDFKEIKELRNKVMHHNVVILENKKGYKDMLINKQIIANRISILAKYLPEGYGDNFIRQINDLKCDRVDYKVTTEVENE